MTRSLPRTSSNLLPRLQPAQFMEETELIGLLIFLMETTTSRYRSVTR